MALRPFEFIVLALASFRLQRIVTQDDWPPSEWFRNKLEGAWLTLFTCGWCFGFWVSAAVFAEHHFLAAVPFIVYALLAGAAVVGLLAEWSSE